MENWLQQVAVWAVPVGFAVILHEISHGAVAFLLGDTTARDAGRLTLNPLPHIDPFGTVILPALLKLSGSPFIFGYARPVPVNFSRLGSPKRDMVLVAAAGPLTNLTLATISAILFSALEPVGFLAEMLRNSVVMNVVLATFNLLPVPPLDGGRVMTGLLPLALARPFARLERFGILIVIGLLASGVLDVVLWPIVRVLLNALASI